jgi:hypothetical protein
MKIKWSTLPHIDGLTKAAQAAYRPLVSGCGRWVIAPTFAKGVYRLLDSHDKAAWHESGLPAKDYPFPLGPMTYLKRLANSAPGGQHD